VSLRAEKEKEYRKFVKRFTLAIGVPALALVSKDVLIIYLLVRYGYALRKAQSREEIKRVLRDEVPYLIAAPIPLLDKIALSLEGLVNANKAARALPGENDV